MIEKTLHQAIDPLLMMAGNLVGMFEMAFRGFGGL